MSEDQSVRSAEILAGLRQDINAWVEREIGNNETIPDFWDDCSTSERLAAYLAMCGYQKVRREERSEDKKPYYISESYTLRVDHSTVGLWYVKGSMHKGLFVIGHTLGEALGKVESAWVDLQRVEREESADEHR